ncbi:AAA family ATPase [Myxococcota bacterium]|nr:AAA family ATPase [Myxococcota bacterium]
MLTSLHLKGFKSFDDERMALGGLTVLVGANASGKSNVLDAIRLLQGLALGKPVSTAIRGEWGVVCRCGRGCGVVRRTSR